MDSSTSKKKSGSGISIRTIDFIMIGIAIVLAILLIYTAFRTTNSYTALQKTTETYLACQNDASSLMEASDYLTEQVRDFVITGNPESVDAFFTEVYETRRRDLALEDLGNWFSEEQVYEFLEDALDRSNNLVTQEYHAMRLTIAARGYDPADFPDVIFETPLTEEETALTSEEQTEQAIDLVFGESYQIQKNDIREDVSNCLEILLSITQTRQNESSQHFVRLLQIQTLLAALLLVIVILVVYLTYRLVLRPLSQISDQIRNHEILSVDGSSELQLMAQTYNHMYEQTQLYTDQLSYEASHDNLTGLYNRGVFDQMREAMDPEHMALIIVDVDKFKEVNDRYGHETGDRILKRVADLLSDAFRSEDYVCRIGGDEFAILMVHASSILELLVRDKLMDANHKLQQGTEDLPPVSLSIGVAFGDRKNPTDDIYKDADAALYRVKTAGRANIAFY